MAPETERYKVAYTLHFHAGKLAEVGALCAQVNLEVLHTNASGEHVAMLVKVAPEDAEVVRERLDARVVYESPKAVTRRVLVPQYASPVEEIEARRARAARVQTRQSA